MGKGAKNRVVRSPEMSAGPDYSENFLISFLRAFLLSILWQGQLEQKRHLRLYFSQHFDFIVLSQ